MNHHLQCTLYIQANARGQMCPLLFDLQNQVKLHQNLTSSVQLHTSAYPEEQKNLSNRVRPIPVSTDTCQYQWVSVSADTYFNIGADISSSFTCLNSQHSCMHSYSFKPIVCLILRNRFLQHCRQQQVGHSSQRCF